MKRFLEMSRYILTIAQTVELHEKRGWSQWDLARALNEHRQTIHTIEVGDANPTVHTLNEIAKVLDVALMEIFRF